MVLHAMRCEQTSGSSALAPAALAADAPLRMLLAATVTAAGPDARTAVHSGHVLPQGVMIG